MRHDSPPCDMTHCLIPHACIATCMCCSVLQCVAVCCSVLQWVAVGWGRHIRDMTHSYVIWRIASHLMHASPHACVAVCCSVLQWVAMCCSELQWVAVGWGRHMHDMTHSYVIRRIASHFMHTSPHASVAVCCSVLQCIAVCCRHMSKCIHIDAYSYIPVGEMSSELRLISADALDSHGVFSRDALENFVNKKEGIADRYGRATRGLVVDELCCSVFQCVLQCVAVCQ